MQEKRKRGTQRESGPPDEQRLGDHFVPSEEANGTGHNKKRMRSIGKEGGDSGHLVIIGNPHLGDQFAWGGVVENQKSALEGLGVQGQGKELILILQGEGEADALLGRQFLKVVEENVTLFGHQNPQILPDKAGVGQLGIDAVDEQETRGWVPLGLVLGAALQGGVSSGMVAACGVCLELGPNLSLQESEVGFGGRIVVKRRNLSLFQGNGAGVGCANVVLEDHK